ncbi:MAG: DUF6153 family protein [Nakamurella multipartita]|jgi:hypothetical protein
MNPVPSVHTARRVTARAVARWLLLVAVAAGIFGMHALTAEDTGHGHGVLPVASSAATGHAGMNPDAAVFAPDPGGFQTVAGGAGHGGDTAIMAGCLLFLVVGAAALIAALLQALRGSARAAADRVAAAAITGVRGRGPPPRPRVALCVIRT